jgi:fatty acid desaturase
MIGEKKKKKGYSTFVRSLGVAKSRHDQSTDWLPTTRDTQKNEREKKKQWKNLAFVFLYILISGAFLVFFWSFLFFVFLVPLGRI